VSLQLGFGRLDLAFLAVLALLAFFLMLHEGRSEVFVSLSCDTSVTGG
jgi:hypothetical protein